MYYLYTNTSKTVPKLIISQKILKILWFIYPHSLTLKIGRALALSSREMVTIIMNIDMDFNLIVILLNFMGL